MAMSVMTCKESKNEIIVFDTPVEPCEKLDKKAHIPSKEPFERGLNSTSPNISISILNERSLVHYKLINEQVRGTRSSSNDFRFLLGSRDGFVEMTDSQHLAERPHR